MARLRRLPLGFVLGVVVIDAMGVGLIMPVMPDLLRDVMDSSLASAALWGGVLSAAFAVMQFLFAPLVGALSDSFGRRVVMLVSVAAVGAAYLVMGVAWSIWVLLGARLAAGVAAATQSTAAAAMADVSSAKDRAAGFGMVGAAFGVGFVLGPALGGVLGHYGTRAPFFAAGALALAAWAAGWLVMPETLAPGKRSPLRLGRANPLGALTDIGRLPGIGRLLTLLFLYQFAFMVYPAVWPYFAVSRFGWGPSRIGMSLALFGIGYALTQGLLVRPVLDRLGERGTVLMGLVLTAVALVLIGIIPNGTLVLFLTPIATLGAIAPPAVQGMMSRRVGAKRQGRLQGLIASVTAVAAVGAPLLMTAVFSWFTHDDTALTLPGAPFFLAALLSLGCIAILQTTPRAQR